MTDSVNEGSLQTLAGRVVLEQMARFFSELDPKTATYFSEALQRWQEENEQNLAEEDFDRVITYVDTARLQATVVWAGDNGEEVVMVDA